MRRRRRGDTGTRRMDESSIIPTELSSVQADSTTAQQLEDVTEARVAAPGQLARGSRRVLEEVAAMKSVQLAAAFAVIAVVMAWIEFSGPAILDVDGYYHIRWSHTLRESFPRLPAFQALD